jgi:hypothetical protein
MSAFLRQLPALLGVVIGAAAVWADPGLPTLSDTP